MVSRVQRLLDYSVKCSPSTKFVVESEGESWGFAWRCSEPKVGREGNKNKDGFRVGGASLKRKGRLPIW